MAQKPSLESGPLLVIHREDSEILRQGGWGGGREEEKEEGGRAGGREGGRERERERERERQRDGQELSDGELLGPMHGHHSMP